MTAISKAEAALITAKAKCFKVCGAAESTEADVLAKLHEPHRAQLEAAYLAFQQASGETSDSNPANGETALTANLVVDSGVNP